jgi:hypothetical protein
MSHFDVIVKGKYKFVAAREGYLPSKWEFFFNKTLTCVKKRKPYLKGKLPVYSVGFWAQGRYFFQEVEEDFFEWIMPANQIDFTRRDSK